METANKIGLGMGTLALICLVFISFGIYSGLETTKILDQECQDLGFSEYDFKMGFRFCKDEIGSLHYVDYECDYKIEFLDLFPKDCDLHKITVGEVEVKG